jgi:ribonuclease HI
VRWHWVKGHAGHDENERADQLAREGVAMARLKGFLLDCSQPSWRAKRSNLPSDAEEWIASSLRSSQ